MTERHQGFRRARDGASRRAEPAELLRDELLRDEVLRDEVLRDEVLSGHLDGMLDPREGAMIERLLAENAEAAEALTGLRRARDMVAALELIPAPRSFAIPATAGRARGMGWFRGLEWAVRGAAGIAAIGFAVAVVDLGGSTESTGPAGVAAAGTQVPATVASVPDVATPAVVTTVESRTRALTEATTAAPSGATTAGAVTTPNTTAPALAPRTAPPSASAVEASGFVAPASAPVPASETAATAPARRAEPAVASPVAAQSSAPSAAAESEVPRSASVAQPTAAVVPLVTGADAGTAGAATASDEANAAPLLGGLAGALVVLAVMLRLARTRVRA